jgi:hypothetical protein
MSEEPPRLDDDVSDGEADAALRASASRRRRLIVFGAAAIVVAIIIIGTVLGDSLADVPWLAVVAVLLLLGAIWRLEGRRLRG